jgi:phosphopantetheinyl transferase
MDPAIENCIVTEQALSAFRVQKLLRYPHLLTFVLIDIQLLMRQLEALNLESVSVRYLSDREQIKLGEFRSEKRKQEWLGGRIAAKHAAARLIEKGQGKPDNVLSFPDLTIIADENGRPSLITNTGKRIHADIPDISISHSVSLAAAMAAAKGFCGIDIQKITSKVIKVQERFCSPAEKQILQASFPWQPQNETAALTKLWAAKEALRKASNMKVIPGFLDLKLIKIHEDLFREKAASWVFVFRLKPASRLANHRNFVLISLIKDYALALTVMEDTLQ